MPTSNIEPNKLLVCNFACQWCWSSPNQSVPWIARHAEVWMPLFAGQQKTQPSPDGTKKSSGSFIQPHARRPLCARAKCFKNTYTFPVSRTNRGDGLLLRSRVPKCICFAFRASEFLRGSFSKSCSRSAPPWVPSASGNAMIQTSARHYSLRGSNPRPMAHKTIALTTELREHVQAALR